MENRVEELSKLVVEQALELSELRSGVVESTPQPTLLQVAKLEIFELTERVGVLSQQVRDRVKTIESYKGQLRAEVKEINSLRKRNGEMKREIDDLNVGNEALSRACQSKSGVIDDYYNMIQNLRVKCASFEELAKR